MNKKLPAWLVLTLIALVAAICLAGTYTLTKETIAKRALEDQIKVRSALLPAASAFEEIKDAEGLDSLYKGLDAQGNTAGYVAVKTVTGFGGDVEITAGLDTAGTLTGINVGGTNFAETAGLGAKAKDAAFTEQFKGLTAPLAIGDNVDAITAATITSSAVVRGVNGIAEAVAPIAGFKVKDTSTAGALGNGRYAASVRGFGGPVYVEFQLDGAGVITEIIIGDDSFAETANYGKRAQEPAFYEQFIGKAGLLTLGTDIDALSGATITSKAVVDAVNKAMLYFIDPAAAAQAEADSVFTLPEIPADAVTATASKKGYGGPVAATVTFDKDVTTILMVEFGDENFAESDGFGVKIKEDFFWQQFINKSVPLQEGDIDLIAGATVSSTAAFEAVNKAYHKLVPEAVATPTPVPAVSENADPFTASSSSKGYGGPVQVTLTIDEAGVITALTVGGDAFAETSGIGTQVLDAAFAQQFIGKACPVAAGDIDLIAGATVSSSAVLNAVNKAYAKLVPAPATPTPVPAVSENADPFTAASSSKGYGGPVQVTVTIDDKGVITALTVGGDAFAETSGIGTQVLDAAFAQQFVGKTYPVAAGDIDMITNATVSSTAVLNAVNKALEKLGAGK